MPKGQYERKPKEVEVVENVPRETIPVERVRQYSTNKDHKGEDHPLCLNPICKHREDMHYVEHRRIERRLAKNLQGDTGEIEVLIRENIYTGSRPCNHACLCKAFE